VYTNGRHKFPTFPITLIIDVADGDTAQILLIRLLPAV
jgi:hypothetical protein